jgi:hypothetical protein
VLVYLMFDLGGCGVGFASEVFLRARYPFPCMRRACCMGMCLPSSVYHVVASRA